MTPGAPLVRLLMAVSAAAAVAGEPGTALPPTKGGATLAFVFDVTGSMWDDLMQVIDGASRILERSLSSGSQTIANYALVPFHDPGSAPRAPAPPAGRPVAARSPACPPAVAPWAHLDARGLRGGRAGAPSRTFALFDPGHGGQASQLPLPSPREPALPSPAPPGLRCQPSGGEPGALRSEAVQPPPGCATSASDLTFLSLTLLINEVGRELAETLKAGVRGQGLGRDAPLQRSSFYFLVLLRIRSQRGASEAGKAPKGSALTPAASRPSLVLSRKTAAPSGAGSPPPASSSRPGLPFPTPFSLRAAALLPWSPLPFSSVLGACP